MLFVSFVAVAMVASAMQEPAAASFCQRMAAKLPMKEKRVAGVQRAFDMQMLSATQRLLTGGSSHFSVQLEPIEQTEAEAARLRTMCQGVTCTMEGPLRFTLGLKDGSTHQFEARPGERMRVEAKGTRIRCSDL